MFTSLYRPLLSSILHLSFVFVFPFANQKRTAWQLPLFTTHKRSHTRWPRSPATALTRALCDFITSGLIVFSASQCALVEPVATRASQQQGRGAEGMSRLLFTSFLKALYSTPLPLSSLQGWEQVFIEKITSSLRDVAQTNRTNVMDCASFCVTGRHTVFPSRGLLSASKTG